MERIDDICADQVGTSDRQRVDPIGLAVPVQRQPIHAIIRGRNIQVREEKSSEYRVLVTGLPVEPGDFHMLALIGFQSKGHFATWVARLRQPRCDFQSDGAEQ